MATTKIETALPLKTDQEITPKPSTTIASPTVVSPTTVISPSEQGWKITIKNADGTSNEVVIEPKPPVEDLEDAVEEVDDKPAPMSTRLRVYLGIQYALNASLAIIIIAFMVLTLVKYYSTKNIAGAWPANAVLSPTFLMLVVSCINVVVDAANLLVQCCGPKIIARMANVVTRVRQIMSTVTAFLPVVAVAHSGLAQSTSNGADLWGFSCSPAGDVMGAVNGSATVCMANQTAWILQIAQIIFQFLSVFIPLYAKMRPVDKPKPDLKTPAGAKKPGKYNADNEKNNLGNGDEEVDALIGDFKEFTTTTTPTKAK